jgi:hypothetical protein
MESEEDRVMEARTALNVLEAKRAAEAQMATAATCPPWRHAIFGLMMGGLIASPAVDYPLRFAILAGLLCLVPIIIRSDRKRTGMFINGYRRGKTRIVVFGILVIELGLYTIGLVRSIDHGDHLTPLLLGAAGVVIGIVGSILWQRVFVREMGA